MAMDGAAGAPVSSELAGRPAGLATAVVYRASGYGCAWAACTCTVFAAYQWVGVFDRRRAAPRRIVAQCTVSRPAWSLEAASSAGSSHPRTSTTRDASTVYPTCGGALKAVKARRQITLPERFRTKKEAEARLIRGRHADMNGAFAEPAELTLRDYLENEWLPSLAHPRTLRRTLCAPTRATGHRTGPRSRSIAEVHESRRSALQLASRQPAGASSPPPPVTTPSSSCTSPCAQPFASGTSARSRRTASRDRS